MNTILCLKENYKFVTKVFLPYPSSVRPHFGKCSSIFKKLLTSTPLWYVKKSRKSRCKKAWKIIKNFLISSDKQTVELSKLHSPIFAANAECFIIRKCDSSLEKQQAKPKFNGGKDGPQRDLLSLWWEGTSSRLKAVAMQWQFCLQLAVTSQSTYINPGCWEQEALSTMKKSRLCCYQDCNNISSLSEHKT